MDSEKLKAILAEHKKWVTAEGGAKADLRGTYLRGADLRGADLDYSCWPLWCGSQGVKVDVNIASQLAAHFCALDCKDEGYQKARAAILGFAHTNKHAKELGL